VTRWPYQMGGPCLQRSPWWLAWALCALLLCSAPARAHLIAAQKGTLNLVGDAAFLVLSVPVSALHGVDDNGDAALSKAELRSHTESVRAQVLAGVKLLGPDGALPLQLVMVDIALPDAPPSTSPNSAAEQAAGPTAGLALDKARDAEPNATASHLTVLGRFALRPAGSNAGAGDALTVDGLSLRFTLFGAQASERQQDLTITRQQEMQWLRFTPEAPTHALLPGPFAVLAEYVHSGAAHVLGGADHLLFLLVVLAAGWGWRALLAVLTCFTLGHALTLAACVWGEWSAPARIVEPAIAVTIVGMAAFDAWRRWRDKPPRLELRLALVFACALIHGLGLADALTDLTQWPTGSRSMLWALTGFNLGIELAQIAVAAGAGLLWWALCRAVGPAAHGRAGQFATIAGMAGGTFWFIERVLQAV
jgi:HupE / UreJ protein